MKNASPFLGFGLGLRTDHFQHIVDNKPELDWFEILSENYMVAGGKPRYFLDAIKEHYPIVMHGVSMSIGSTDPLNMDYLKQLKALADHVQPKWLSDHLCWTTVNNVNSHDLLPLPYNEEAINHLVDRIKTAQEILERPFLIENVSSYLSYNNSEMEEWEFLNQIAQLSGCKILLDINNIYVSARNHGFKSENYIDGIDKDHVWQFHLAGHTDYGTYVIDTHDHDVPSPVWDLYRYALRRFGAISTMIERDDHIPAFNELYKELQIAKKIAVEELPNIDNHAKLKQLQDNFSDYLLSKGDEITNVVVDQGELDRYSRLNIYKNAYNVRLFKCIETDHPILAIYLGDELFEKMASAYIEKYPSSFTSLRHFCDELPTYLIEDDFFSTVPILYEIATFERLMMSAFDAAESEKRASINELQSIEPKKWPSIKLKFHPSVSIFETKWNSVESWQALKNEETPEAATENERYWIIWRGVDRLTQFRSLPIEAYIMFNCFNGNYNFAEVCDFLLEHLAEDQIGPLTVQHLSHWLEIGLIYKIKSS